MQKNTPHLSERNLQTIYTIGRCKFLSSHQLKREFYPDAKHETATQRLTELARWGFLSRELRWTPLSRPIYGQSKLSVKASLQGYCSYRITLLYVSHLLPCRLMDITAPSHGRRPRACDTPMPDGAARRCKTQSSILTLAVPPARCCTLVDTPPRT